MSMVGGGPQSETTLTRDQCSVSKLGTSCEQPIRLEHHRTYLDTKSSEVPSLSTMLGGPAALREPQRTATNDTLRGDWRGTSLASP